MSEQQDVINMFGVDPQNTSKLSPNLRAYLQKVPRLGLCLRSPWVYQTPFYSWKIANEMYDAKIERIEHLIATNDYERAIWYYERPYRMPTLAEWVGKVPIEQLKTLLSSVWIDTEFPYQYANLPLILFKQTGFITDNEEKWKTIRKQGELSIFRGAHRIRDKSGISWTLDRDKAIWFAKRFSPVHSYLFSGKIKSYNVLGYFYGRDEEEIVIDSQNINHIKNEPL